MVSVDIELALVGLTAMLEPATLLSSVLALVVSDRPLRTGFWFYVGGMAATLFVGVLAAFLLGNAAASHTSTPKTWVSIATIVAGAVVLGYVVRLVRRPADTNETAGVTERMSKVASSSAPAIIAAGAVLANPGIFMLIAAKNISQLDPSTSQYLLDWILFAVVAFLPLGIALVMLLAAPDSTKPRLVIIRRWIEAHARTIITVILFGLAISLLRDGITGLTG